MYLEPAWRAQQPGWSEWFRGQKALTVAQIAAANPQRSADEAAAKFAMLRRSDPETVGMTENFDGWPVSPPLHPSLVLRGSPSMTITDEHAARLRDAGNEVATVPDAGHVIHPGMSRSR